MASVSFLRVWFVLMYRQFLQCVPPARDKTGRVLALSNSRHRSLALARLCLNILPCAATGNEYCYGGGLFVSGLFF